MTFLMTELALALFVITCENALLLALLCEAEKFGIIFTEAFNVGK
jgi:hypothetical protein